MDVTLPNGKVMYGLPDDVTQKDVAGLAIGQGYASISDFAELFPGGELPKPEGDNDPTIMENVGGVIADLGIGAQRATKGLIDLAAIPMPESLEKYTTDPASEFFERGIEATEWIKPESYKKAQQQTAIKRDSSGEFESFQAPSWQSVAGITAGSLPQIPSFLVGGGGVGKALKASKWLAAHPKFAEAIGYGIVNAALVAPGQWRDTYNEAIDAGIPEEEARDAADAASLLTAAVSGTTGAVGGAIGAKMGMQSKNVGTAMAKGFVAEAPFEGIEEAGQSAAADIGMGRPVSGVNALEGGTMGFLGGGLPGAGVAGVTNLNANVVDTGNKAPESVIEMEKTLRRDRIQKWQADKDILTEAYNEGRGVGNTIEGQEEVDPMEWAREQLQTIEVDLDDYIKLRKQADDEDFDAQIEIESWINDQYISNDELNFINSVIDGKVKPPSPERKTVTRAALGTVNQVIQDVAKVRGYDEDQKKKIVKALQLSTDQKTDANKQERIEARAFLDEVTAGDKLIGANLQKASKLLKAAKEQPVPSVAPTPIDMERYGKFVTNLEQRMKKLGLKEFHLSLVNRVRNAAETHNGELIYGVRKYKGEKDNKLVSYDKNGQFVYDEGDQSARGMFDPTIGRIFLSIDQAFASKKQGGKPLSEKEAMDNFVKSLNHETIHALRSIDLFTKNEWDVLLKAATNRKSKHLDGQGNQMTYKQWAEKNYSDLDIIKIEEEAISELISGENNLNNMTGLPRTLINRLKAFITQMKSALNGTGFDTFDSILHNYETGKIGKRERGRVRTIQEIKAKGLEDHAVYDSEQKLKDGFSQINADLRDQGLVDLNDPEWAGGTRYTNMRDMVASLESEGLETQALNNIKGKANQWMQLYQRTANKIGADFDAPSFQRRRGVNDPSTPSSFNAPDEYSRGKHAIWKLQDKLVGLKDIEKAINEARTTRGEGKLTALESAYVGEELSHGRIGERAREFTDRETKPLIESISEAGIGLADLDEFLVLRHAIERNERIRKINPDKQDGGAGKMGENELTDAFVLNEMQSRFGMEWDANLGKWRDADNVSPDVQNHRDKLNGIAEKIDDIVKGTLTEAYESGLIDDGDYTTLNTFYRYYTPLRGFGKEMLQELDEDTYAGSAGTGGSINIIGKHSQKSKGRSSEAYSPTATIIAERERTIARGVKNKDINNRMFNLIEANPNPEVWEIIGPGHPRYDQQWDSSYTYVGRHPDIRYGTKKKDISEQPDQENWVKRVRQAKIEQPLNAKGDELIGVKVDGQQYFMDIKDDRLRRSLLNADQQSQNKIVNALGNVNRFLSFMNTTLNPEFVIGNFSRDIQTAIASIITENNITGGMLEGSELNTKKITKEVVKGLFESGKTFYKKARQQEGRPVNLSEQQDREIMEFLNAGAKADWFHSRPVEQQRANLQNMLDMLNRTHKGNAIKKMQDIKNFVEDGNAAVENAVRFSTFKVAKKAFTDAGMNTDEAVERAASMAKNMTINFNRKGESGNLLNSLYLFFNAQVQGTAVILRGMQSKSKQKIIGGITAMGMFMSMLHEFAEDEDDPESKGLEEVEDFVRERNMIIPIPGSNKSVKIPLPYGYNFFYQLGSNAYLMGRGKMKIGQGTAELANTFLGSFNPLGSQSSDDIAATTMKYLAPTALTPFVEITANKNYFGGPIYKEQFDVGTPLPDSSRAFKNTDPILKWIASSLNDITGGNAHESGFIDVSPDTMSYLIGYGLGGAGAFGERAVIKPAGKLMEGKPPFEEFNDIPFVRRFMHEYNDKPSFENYYDRRDMINQKMDHIETLKGAELKSYRDENLKYLKFKEVYDQSEKQLKVLRNQQKKIEEILALNPNKATELSANQERIQDNIDKIIRKVNSFYEEKVEK